MPDPTVGQGGVPDEAVGRALQTFIVTMQKTGTTREGLRAVLVEAGVERLRHAIQDHRMSIRAAGEVRVDPRDVPVAEEKHRADERLWSVLDA